MTKISLSASFVTEASPVLDDASPDSPDAYLRAWAPLAAKVAVASADKYGYINIDVTVDEARLLVTEGTYRAEACRDRARDAWDNSERMQMLGSASGCAGVAKRAQKIVDAHLTYCEKCGCNTARSCCCAKDCKRHPQTSREVYSS